MKLRIPRVPNAIITATCAAVMLGLIATGEGALSQAAGQPSGVIAPGRHIGLGAWTAGLYDPASGTLDPGALSAYEQLTRKRVLYAHYYLGWQYLANPVILSQFGTLRAHGWQPVVSVSPYYFSGCSPTTLPLYRAIAEGKCDAFLRAAGRNLSQLKQPFYMLFAYEMNNPQNPWSISGTGSTNADFVAAWRHMYTVFAEEQAIDVVWVFCPNIPNTAASPYSAIYPGDAYVDWVGMDGYNWGTTQSWSKWTSFAGVFEGPYDTLVHIAPNKPVMIGEVNTTNQGGDKGAWYTDMLTKQLPYNYPNIQAVMFYNEDRTAQEHVNWRVDVTPESLRAYIQGVHSQVY